MYFKLKQLLLIVCHNFATYLLQLCEQMHKVREWFFYENTLDARTPINATFNRFSIHFKNRRCQSKTRSEWLPYHKQKIVLIFSAMRHYAEELRSQGYRVDYRFANTFKEGLDAHIAAYNPHTVLAHWPTDWTMRRLMTRWADEVATTEIIRLEEDALFLVEREAWPSLLPTTQKMWRMETTYQKLRRRFNILIDEDQPLGVNLNYDTYNQTRPDKKKIFIDPLSFESDDITRQVMSDVASNFPEHPGNISSFQWPVTHAQAKMALDHFIQFRLPDFGDHQDAMLEDKPFMAHSLLASAINIGLLQPLDVINAAEQAYRDGLAPLAAVEGFIRQILGWREYVRGVYIVMGPSYSLSNELAHIKDLPAVYWGAPSKLNCLNQCVSEVLENSYSHHIQRLMILGNFALLYGVEPKQVNDWFNFMYVDAFDWVVTPNVIGMSQHADGGRMASKPYVSSAQYIKKMSNYCANCQFDPDQKTGEQACPFNALYWAFIDRHAERWAKNPRMNMIVASWNKMDPTDRQAIRDQAATFKP
jgi:deoxyribodipyrimidine photolyase-related protein